MICDKKALRIEDGRKGCTVLQEERGMSVKINTTMQYNGEENSSRRKSDSSIISQSLRLVSNRLKNI